MTRPPPYLTGKRVRVTLAADRDAAALLDFHARNREHLAPWMPSVPADFLTLGYWRKWGGAARWLHDNDQALRLVMRAVGAQSGPILGQINFSNIQRGPFQAAYLGYHLDAACEGQGLMHEALELSIDFAFSELGLHRIMANHMPENERSAHLLERLGFADEGYARDYLFIDGAWRDHVLTALVNPRAPAPPGRQFSALGEREG